MKSIKNLQVYLVGKITKNYFIILILFSLLASIYHGLFIYQRGLTAGLIISGDIFYPNEKNVLYIWYNNSWSIYHQIISFLINSGINNVNFLNVLILFLSTLANTFGLFLITNSILKNHLFALFISIFILITQINFGNLDFPVLVYSEHTNASIGSAVAILVIGFIGNKNYKLAYFFSLLNILLHLVIGLWIFFIFLISLFFFRNSKKNYNLNLKNLILTTLPILILFVLFFVKFYLNLVEIPFNKDLELYQKYLNIWDNHRSVINPTNYTYIFLSFVMCSMIIFLLKNKNQYLNHSQEFLLKFILSHVILSFIIYIIYKNFPQIFPNIVVRAMPNRLFLIHSLFGSAIIFSIFIMFLKQNKINSDYLKYFIPVVLIVLLSGDFKRYFDKIISLPSSYVNKTFYDGKFWNSINRDKSINGFLLTSVGSCGKTIQRSKKPILICIETIDYANYIPELLPPIKSIISDIYEIDFYNPPEKMHGGIWYDETYRNVFENRNYNDWILISEKYNLSGLILPNTWLINLKQKYLGKEFAFYSFEK